MNMMWGVGGLELHRVAAPTMVINHERLLVIGITHFL